MSGMLERDPRAGGLVDRRLLRRFDWGLLLCLVGIVAISLPTIYSATWTPEGATAWHFVQRQLVWLGLGVLAMVLVNTLDHHQFPHLTRAAYWTSLALLAAVLLIGTEVNGAKSWFSFGSIRLQPSEFAKLAVILALAKFFDDEEIDAGDWQTLCGSALILAGPLLLILAQPDLGTSLTFISIWLVLLWWNGARWWQLVLLIALGLLAFAALWWLDILADYQKARILVLFNPDADPRGQGYNLRQALIAVGSGGLTGRGWLQGTQTHLRFLPERQTDFIFAVLCEEWGLLGGAVLLALYGGLLLRGWTTVALADSRFGRGVAVGCTTILLTHVWLNIGMVLGVLPITGLPLPAFSYGGSSLLTTLTVVGLLLNVRMRRGGLNY
ncbi:MAG: rod shape-determining protein RodA [Fimbriimonadaceae bacterium]|nr:rod shape-determining protein RodA [Fimbriimonadaceae bacterium]